LILFIPFHIVYTHLFLAFILPHRTLIGIKAADAKKALADRARWRSDERLWVRDGKLPRCGWMDQRVPESPRWTEREPERVAEQVKLEQKRQALQSRHEEEVEV